MAGRPDGQMVKSDGPTALPVGSKPRMVSRDLQRSSARLFVSSMDGEESLIVCAALGKRGKMFAAHTGRKRGTSLDDAAPLPTEVPPTVGARHPLSRGKGLPGHPRALSRSSLRTIGKPASFIQIFPPPLSRIALHHGPSNKWEEGGRFFFDEGEVLLMRTGRFRRPRGLQVKACASCRVWPMRRNNQPGSAFSVEGVRTPGAPFSRKRGPTR